MSLEPQAESQTGRPVDGRGNMLVLGERRSLMDMWRVLMKQRFTILAVTLLSVAAATWHAFRTVPVYESVGRVEIKPNALASSDQASAVEEYVESPLQSEMNVLESDSVLFQTAENLHLNRSGAVPANRRPPPRLPRSSTALWSESSKADCRFLSFRTRIFSKFATATTTRNSRPMSSISWWKPIPTKISGQDSSAPCMCRRGCRNGWRI